MLRRCSSIGRVSSLRPWSSSGASHEESVVSLLKTVSVDITKLESCAYSPIDDDPCPRRKVAVHEIAREKVAEVDGDTSKLGKSVSSGPATRRTRLTKVLFKTRLGMIGYAA